MTSTVPQASRTPDPSRIWVRILGAMAALVALGLVLRAGWFDPGRVQEFILSFGVLAPVIWSFLYLAAVFIPYATTVMTVAAGLAFGVVWGAILTYGVTLFASLLPFAVSRRLGRAWVERSIGNTRVEKYVDLINRHAFLIFFYLRLLPSIPYEVQNHIAGVTRITYRHFLLASALGNGPILVILVLLGDGLAAPASPRFWIGAGLYGLALLSPVLIALTRRALGKPPLFMDP